MDTLTFVKSIVGELAWPLVALVLVLVLRRELRLLVPSLKSLKLGPAQAEFDRDLTRARDLADASAIAEPPPAGGLEAQEPAPSVVESTLLAAAAEMVAVSPRSVVLEAWIQVEKAASRALQAQNLRRSQDRIRPDEMEQLANRGFLTRTDVDLFEHLRHLRNRAAHREVLDVTREDALEYALIAARLADRLELATNDSEPND